MNSALQKLSTGAYRHRFLPRLVARGTIHYCCPFNYYGSNYGSNYDGSNYFQVNRFRVLLRGGAVSQLEEHSSHSSAPKKSEI